MPASGGRCDGLAQNEGKRKHKMTASGTTVKILDCGAMSCDLTWLLLEPGRTIRSRAQKDQRTEWYRASTHCVLVETAEGRLLWDTSCPRDWETRWVPMGLQEFFPYDQVGEDEYFDSRLHEQGLELSDIDYVVLSHLHFDHAGNAQLFKGTDAKMVCSKKEHDFAFGFDGVFTGGHLKIRLRQVEVGNRRRRYRVASRCHPYPGARPHPRHDGHARRPPRNGDHDLHFRRGVHGRHLWATSHPGIPDQRPDHLVPVGREDPKAGGGDQRHVGVRSRLRTDDKLRVAPESYV